MSASDDTTKPLDAKSRIRWADMLSHDQLDLSDLRLASLPREITRLTRLTALNLSGNRFESLPDDLAPLTLIQDLDLSRNKLSDLPAWLRDMGRLRRLDLSSNQLADLPEWLPTLTDLQELYLHDNVGLLLPPDLLGPTRSQVTLGQAQPSKPATILEYYVRSLQSRPLNEAKLILVGQGNVGKTSLVNRLVDDTFNPKEPKTDGIKLTDWRLRLRDEDVTLHIWDFGGQEVMHATHQFFLTQRSLYLLILNGRQGGEDRDAEYWLRLIASFGAESPVVVVLNKIREHPFDLNRHALEQKYRVVRFIRTDCEDGTGLAELRQTIERETDRLEHLRDVFPSSWFAIKNRLAGMHENFLSFERYRTLCREKGEPDAAAQDQLAASLHSLGIALNYKDDPRLRDTSVLKPHWVTNGIYRLLNARKVADEKGVLALSDVSDILDLHEYPREKHGFLLELMRKFELCFEFPEDTERRYLIPELLNKQEPQVTLSFLPTQCLNFEYRYPVLPEGLLPRFIVRTHALSAREPTLRWRTGVVLEWESCRALIKADPSDGKVSIGVQGPDAEGRRRLLAVIRFDFERIHGQFAKLGVSAKVPVPDRPEVTIDYEELIAFERAGETLYKKVIDGEVVSLVVREMLSGVDLGMAARRAAAFSATAQLMRVFYSYSHRDEGMREELETHLKLLERLGLISGWHDRKITAGAEWKGKIDDELERSDIILLLVSPAFIGSDYCIDVELKLAMARHDRGEARVVPIIIRDLSPSWQRMPFGKLQVAPTDGQAVDLWANRDSAWRNVVEHIEALIDDLRDTRERRGAPTG